MYRKDWKIIYSSAEGVEARALEFLYGEMGDYMLRNREDYALHTLPCLKADATTPDTNAPPEENAQMIPVQYAALPGPVITSTNMAM